MRKVRLIIQINLRRLSTKNINKTQKSINLLNDSFSLIKDLNKDFSELEVRVANLEINEKSESGSSYVDITSDTQYQIKGVSVGGKCNFKFWECFIVCR